MRDNYTRLMQENLHRFYRDLAGDGDLRMGAESIGDTFLFKAFGDPCRITPYGITLGETPAPSIIGLLISLYACHATQQAFCRSPYRAFKEFPGSMPYSGAFVTHTEQVLVPHVAAIESAGEAIVRALDGGPALPATPGDFAFEVRPLPKVLLCYIFYKADDEFPASVTCLFSQNADAFLPLDALADVGEYASKKILSTLSN